MLCVASGLVFADCCVCWLLSCVVCNVLCDVCWLLFVACCSLFVVCCLLPVVCRLLHVCRSLFHVRCLLRVCVFATRCLMPAVRKLLVDACRLRWFAIGRMLFVVC